MSSPTLELTELFTNRMVRAGAGAGKTTQLSQRVIRVAEEFYAAHGKLPRVMVTTFTRKATQELKERLVKLACQSKNPHILQFVSSPSLLHVSTIHGVLALYLRRYGHLFNLDAGFQLVDDGQARQLKRTVFRDSLAENESAMELLEYFSSTELIQALSQIDMVRSQNGDVEPFSEKDFIEAFAKTKEKFLRLGEDIYDAIVQESTNEKWIQFGETALKVIRAAAQSNEFTFSGFSESLKAAGPRKPTFSKEEPPFSLDLKGALDKWSKDLEKMTESSTYSVDAYPEIARLHLLIQEISLIFSAKLKEQKARKSIFEMADLENVVLEQLMKEPELARNFASDWDYALTDEYQDTSPLQVRILNELLYNVPQYFVGDPQQSIYLFRGARSEVFFAKENEIRDSKGKLEELSVNYRSTPEFLNFINHQAAEMGDEFAPMTPPIGKEAVSPGAVAVIAPVVDDDESEYAPIASFIASEIEKGARFDDFAILTRQNSKNFDIAKYLEERGILCQVHSASGFFQSREVLDALALLRFLVLPYDLENLVLLLRTPWFKVSDTDLSKWLGAKRETSWDDLAQHEHPTLERLRTALNDSQSVGVFEIWLSLLKSSGAIDYSCYFDGTGRRESNIWKLVSLVAEAQRRPGFNYVQFLDRADNGYVDDDEGEGEAAAIIEPNRVNLMTVHKAKGLKFNKVILPKANSEPKTRASARGRTAFVFDEEKLKYGVSLVADGDDKKSMSLPAIQFLENFSKREIEEHKRLYYVAITRAVQTCFITWKGAIEDESWASYLPTHSEEGEFNFGADPAARYTYSVRRGPFATPSLQTSALRTDEVRQVYRDTSEPLASGRVSVSGLLALIEENQRSVVGAPVDTKVTDKVKRSAESQVKLPYFGVRLHAALEKLKYHPDYDLEQEAEQVDDKNAFLKAIRYVLELETPNMRALFENGDVEWGFQVKTKRGILEGQIDMWGIDGDTLWVVDYKSGDPRYVEKAFRQLELYSYPLMKMLELKQQQGEDTPSKVMLATVFPVAKKVEVREARSIEAIANEFGL